jgi:DNA-binding GntR family transcriptional regulator
VVEITAVHRYGGVMTPEMRKTTRTDAVHARLRSDILAGRLQPGERLKFPDLCEPYEASVGVIREALARLVGEGLVCSQAHQGFVVTPLSEEDLADLTTARLEIEATAFRHAVLDGDVTWEARAVAAHHVLARTPLSDPDDAGRMSDEWARVHRDFHDALLSGCGNRRLLDIARGLRAEADLYQRWSVALGSEPDRRIDDEHRGLLDAALARDPDLAVERLRKHIGHTRELLVDYKRAGAD